MNDTHAQQDFRPVKSSKKRAQKDTPSRRRREARRLRERIEAAADERQEAYREGAHPNRTAALTTTSSISTGTSG